jgi:hypothetical protein
MALLDHWYLHGLFFLICIKAFNYRAIVQNYVFSLQIVHVTMIASSFLLSQYLSFCKGSQQQTVGNPQLVNTPQSLPSSNNLRTP